MVGVFFWRRMLMEQQSLGAMCVAVCSSNGWFLLWRQCSSNSYRLLQCVLRCDRETTYHNARPNHTGSPKPAHYSTTGSPSVCLARECLLYPMCSVSRHVRGMLQCHESCGFECDSACHSAKMSVAPAFSHHTLSHDTPPAHGVVCYQAARSCTQQAHLHESCFQSTCPISANSGKTGFHVCPRVRARGRAF